ncbi:ABC transporter permease [Halobacteriales archaeon QH_8_64_26]|nr:MAG: ABC transporter permease [Halobacteriales archaeon QH_8_64_26]
MLWFVLRRLVWTVFAIYLVLSGAFFLFAYTPDPNLALAQYGLSRKQAIAAKEAFIESRNYDEPILARYVDWVLDYATLDWGQSVTHGEPVTAVLAEAIPITLTYLLPAIGLALVCGIGIGLYTAMHRGGLVDRVARTISYVGLGVPAFFLAEVTLVVAITQLGLLGAYYDTRYGTWTIGNLDTFVLATLVMTTNLLAVQLRYVRAEALERLSADFVRTLRANGSSPLAIARHVFRNASPPLVSLFVTEVLTVLFVSVYVIEVVFRIPGFGQVAYEAILDRDIGLILATTLIPVLLGLLGTLLQDIAYAVLDPRVSVED